MLRDVIRRALSTGLALVQRDRPAVGGEAMGMLRKIAAHRYVVTTRAPFVADREWPDDNRWDSFRRFCDTYGDTEGTVVELGGRVRSPEATSLRDYFPRATFLGVDIHDSPTVDVVADAHQLSQHVEPGTVSVLFSQSVLEHLMYPWVVAREINRVLEVGGVVYINAPQAWPIHESPNDFWRFSDRGLELLFGEDFGFEVIESGHDGEFRMVSRFRNGPLTDIPNHPAWGLAWVLARKVREVEGDAGFDPAKTADRSRQYPS